MNPVPKPPRTPRKARKPLPPSSHPIPRGGKPKPVNRKRKASEFARTYHSKARVEFVKSLPCLYCALLPLRQPLGPSENAHTTGGGMGRKGDYTTISPLCQKHHAMYDEHRAPFDQTELRGWVAECAEIVEAEWRASGRDGE